VQPQAPSISFTRGLKKPTCNATHYIFLLDSSNLSTKYDRYFFTLEDNIPAQILYNKVFLPLIFAYYYLSFFWIYIYINLMETNGAVTSFLFVGMLDLICKKYNNNLFRVSRVSSFFLQD
ncbi:hypothetical protein ACJX0J_037657, partial [Zea mays]